MPFVNATYTGVAQVRRFHFSVGHGDTCACLLDILPQANLPAQDGNLVLTDGVNSLTVPGCRLDLSTVRRTTAGDFVRVRILGPTWHWRYGEISGVYNTPRPNGSVEPSTEKSCRELAALLFDAMKVTAYDVSGLPDTTGPFVNWHGAHAYSELTWLCQLWGCDFGLDVSQTIARIWRVGQGAALPSGGSVRTTGYGVDLAEPPDRIVGYCGPSEYQLKFKLKPVGIDSDFSKRDLADLTYNPGGAGNASGWDGRDPWEPLPVDAPAIERELAKKSLWRMWEIESLSDGTLDVPGYGGQPSSTEDFLPLLPEIAETYQNPNGAYYQKQAYLLGDFAVPGEPASLRNTDHAPCDVPFSLDRETGLVVTRHPVFKVNGDLQYEAAELYLVASCRIRQQGTFSYDGYTVPRQIADNGVGDLPLHRPDLIRRVTVNYNKTTPLGFVDNTANIDAILNAQLDAAQVEYTPSVSEVREYVGLAPIALDGAIRQVSIRGNCTGRDQGCFTMAARNTEWEPGLLRRRQRRLRAEEDRLRVQREIQDADRRRAQRGGVL